MECAQKGKLWMGCNFEPRYDISAPDVSRLLSIDGPYAAEILEMMKAKIYVKDVCTTCGREILRK